MKVKFLNLLTVSLVTLALISPGIIVFAIVWNIKSSLKHRIYPVNCRK